MRRSDIGWRLGLVRTKMKERIVREVEVCHKREREPHVLALG